MKNRRNSKSRWNSTTVRIAPTRRGTPRATPVFVPVRKKKA